MLLAIAISCARDTGDLRRPDPATPTPTAPTPGCVPAAEVCDGADQDCDGVPDDGIPSDGAGCRDPGPPAASQVVSTVTVTLVTGTGTTDGSDDPLQVCLGAARCFDLDLADWDDRQSGTTDVHHLEGLAVPRAEIDRFELSTSTGGDQWDPDGFAVSLDGAPAHCRQVTDLEVGSDAKLGEVLAWTDPDGLTLGCTTPGGPTLTHGPMTGAVGPDHARIWYRTDATRHVELRVAEDDAALAAAAPVHHGYPGPSTDFTGEVDVVGLSPGRAWSYAIDVDGERFGPWSFTTAPADGEPTRFSVGIASCTNDDVQLGFLSVLALDPDLFLFVGDNHYGNTADLGAHRQRYRWAHGRDFRRDVLRAASILATWDDHDFVGNNTDGAATGKDVARRAFDEYWANDAVGTPQLEGVHHTWRRGDVDFVFVDDRTWRGLDLSVPGDAQEAWIVEQVTGSDATFKIVVAGSQWTSHKTIDSFGVWPEAQQRLLDALTTVPGVILVSGDVHRSELRLLDNPAGYPVPEITSSGMAYTPTNVCTTDPDVRACYDGGHSFVALDVDTTAADPVVTATIRDEVGTEVVRWDILRSTLEP